MKELVCTQYRSEFCPISDPVSLKEHFKEIQKEREKESRKVVAKKEREKESRKVISLRCAAIFTHPYVAV